MILLLALLNLAFDADRQRVAVANEQIDRGVRITAVSDEPGAASGVLATAIRISGTSQRGDSDYFLFFHQPGQPRPGAGATCNIGHRRFEFSALVGREMASVIGGRGMTFFECDGAARVNSL